MEYVIKMNVLFIGPLPPPITGQSLACKIFLEELNQYHHVDVVDINKQSLSDDDNLINRIKEVVIILKNVWRKRNNKDIIYLTISESVLGNLKDIFIYLICYKNISKVIIHLHGGSFKKLLIDKYPLLHAINKFFLKKIAGAIVLGQSHSKIFSEFLPEKKIHIVPNFAQDDLFIPQQYIIDKYELTNPLKIIFVSNLMVEKGYQELLDAFRFLKTGIKQKMMLEFAGAFETDEMKLSFLEKIKGIDNIKYHGVVSGAEKQKLFTHAHILCLPTNYLEGQPISILEAYATGCVVITTNKGGICDVFKDKVNGYEVLPKSKESIIQVLEMIINTPEALLPIALHNRMQAEKNYRVKSYNKNLLQVIVNNNANIS